MDSVLLSDFDPADTASASGAMKSKDQKRAEFWVTRANEELERPLQFAQNSKMDDAMYYFLVASWYYRLAGMWEESADCLSHIGGCEINLGERREAATWFEEGAKFYDRTDPAIARDMFSEANTIYGDLGLFPEAGFCCERIAKNCEEALDLDEALHFTRLTVDLYSADPLTVLQAEEFRVKQAKLETRLGRFVESRKSWEVLAKNAMQDNTSQFRAREYLFNASLATLLSENPKKIRRGNLTYRKMYHGAEAVDAVLAVTRAKNFEDKSLKAGKKQSLRGIDPLYEATPHFQFIEDISYTLEDFDIDDFADRVYNINAVVKLDSWQFQMLSHLRDIIVAGPRDWLQAGDRVECKLEEWTKFYGGEVIGRHRFDCPLTGRDLYSFDVYFDDGETGRKMEAEHLRREVIILDELAQFMADEKAAEEAAAAEGNKKKR